MANPVFNNASAFRTGSAVSSVAPDPTTAQPQYGAPAGFERDPARMSYEGVLTKAFLMFFLAASAAVVVGLFAPMLAFPLLIGALVLMLITVFKKGPASPALYLTTITMYGGAAGGISAFYAVAYNGIIMHALIATGALFAATLAAYKSGKIRNIGKIRKFVAIALPAVIVLLIVNLVMVMVSGPQASIMEATLPGTNIPLGLLLSIFLILLGTFMLISDFDFVDTGVREGLPVAYEWTAAFGLVFTTVWVYIQMLRLLSYLRGR